MARIQHTPAIEIFRGNSREVELRPIRDKQFVFDTESQVFYIDVNDQRVAVGKDYDGEFGQIHEKIHEIEDKVKSIKTTLLTQAEIEDIIDIKIYNLINNSIEMSNKINDIYEKLAKHDKRISDLESSVSNLHDAAIGNDKAVVEIKEQVESINTKIDRIEVEKQNKVFSLTDVLHVENWIDEDESGSFFEYYYSNESIPFGSSLTISPVVTNEDEYNTILDCSLMPSIENAANTETQTEYYIFRCINKPDADIEIFISVM